MMRPTLITGGAGFIGTNTADRLLRDGRPVRIVDDLSRPGVEHNLAWLEGQHGRALEVEIGDVTDAGVMPRAVARVDSVFHFAAQVAVTTSLADPMRDLDVNVRGTMQLLEAVRRRPHPPAVVFTSTNKVYGSLSDVGLREGRERYIPADRALAGRGIGEDRPLAFCTPYGCSKGAADQYVLDYAASYGVPSVVFRMSCIYGPHQFGTEDQGWVAHFLISAIEGRAITIYGDGKQLRDVLFVDDLVDALLLARGRANELAGRAFNIGGGPANTISLLELVAMIAELRGAAPEVSTSPWRQGDQRYYVSDTRAFQRATGWRPAVDPGHGVATLHAWLGAARERAAA
jgi:CDP-paratose 2-epimerase